MTEPAIPNDRRQRFVAEETFTREQVNRRDIDVVGGWLQLMGRPGYRFEIKKDEAKGTVWVRVEEQ